MEGCLTGGIINLGSSGPLSGTACGNRGEDNGGTEAAGAEGWGNIVGEASGTPDALRFEGSRIGLCNGISGTPRSCSSSELSAATCLRFLPLPTV